MGTVAGLSGLKGLTILYCPNVTETGFAKLTELRQLEILDLLAFRTPAGALAQLDLPQLRILRVDDLVRGEVPVDVSKLTGLEGLLLSAHHGPALRDEDLACVAGLTHLKRLQTGSPDFTDAGLAHLVNLKAMEVLHIGGPLVTDAGLRNLEGMARLNTLGLTVDGPGEDGLASLMKLESLRSLILTSKQPIDQAAMARLKAKLPTLVTIESHKYKPPHKRKEAKPEREAP